MADSMKKLYLFFYNLSMFLGFAYALTVMSGNYLAKPDVFPTECWSAVGSFFKASILGCSTKTCFSEEEENKRNPPCISLGVSLKGSKRIFDFDQV